ncbi:HAD superfamily hydrolase (TIGR01450 family)/HAD superfamily hydrolase (TIGR01549 family) [Brevibacterium sanguinis]|uniref:HAD superfamily hydrolase (TIGR01450 family)/HAD superfamily hydrolase (TIGR01549 family) n=2 Tax=Brevibacterium TaxID=1696 RepID=A0A366IFS0_9MICO|nr:MULTISPECIES: HAD-IIA family hydrolase [Brevibacterium]RBP61874.1 HAD superfamily hydrolase (TIGR01450 family)/HAD superfamily hydrolase (TIGR01549 family) [Brevibacterium sanguinis]RBP68680.1 HAD superfamily hydrolase (TIGR01450 family)/HAD superfamily hydrolase (TIGR01549 family) [Brevibacterium celere]
MSLGADHGAPGQPGAPIDCVLFDLDGVVYRGPEPVPGAAEGIAFLRDAAIPLSFVTNNATRTPEAVAARITDLGIDTTAAEVTTSAQVLAARLAEKYGAGALIFVVGTTGLEVALESHGLRITRSLDDGPVALAQGLDPQIDYSTIVAAGDAVRSGLDWWASNPDYSMPSPSGEVPGNGAFVEMVARLTGARPTIVGKPSPHMLDHAARRLGARRPLMIGDRLDTDIEGGSAAGFETALVLTGVHDIHDALVAPAHRRPTHILPSLRGLAGLITASATIYPTPATTHPDPDPGVRLVDGELVLDDHARSSAHGIGAALRLAWEALDRGRPVRPGNLPRRIHD